MSQRDDVKREIISCVKAGMSGKMSICKRVADELGVPRPAVRRAAGTLRRRPPRCAVWKGACLPSGHTCGRSGEADALPVLGATMIV